ncbi:hypothetical protein Sinac_1754 [Singulisphaera acidiphila DSM 18658]|uniref:Uncharacterized protein n=1 Tax=Singulisphaera acidiphila (strain ATCC BAA-1392 / DSM 18658 / VKM B-2454 / MOB10) TaxID=886293 RepID=L0DB87_SINAD|nr:hypothetical protein Sinac_1754 [Singulisphaera acidiphila DSM 18658]
MSSIVDTGDGTEVHLVSSITTVAHFVYSKMVTTQRHDVMTIPWERPVTRLGKGALSLQLSAGIPSVYVKRRTHKISRFAAIAKFCLE